MSHLGYLACSVAKRVGGSQVQKILSLSFISGLSGRVMYALLAPSKPKVLSAYDVDMATHTAVKKRRQHYMLR